MVWRTCPVRCKGGRDVAPRTRSKHEKELQDQVDQQLLQPFFPDDTASPSDASRRRTRHHDDDIQGTRSKRARRSNGQGDAGVQLVRAPTNFAQPRLTLYQPARSRRRTGYRRYAEWRWGSAGSDTRICASTLFTNTGTNRWDES